MANSTQPLAVTPGQCPSPLDDRPVGRQPVIQNRGLQVVQTRVESPAHDLAIRAAAMIAKLGDTPIEVLAVGHHCPAVAQAPQHLSREKADRAGYPETSRCSSLKARAQCLRRVFDDSQA